MSASTKRFENVHFGKYEGHPMLLFGKPPSKIYLQFGKTKAKLLLAAINEMGTEEFRILLEDFVA